MYNVIVVFSAAFPCTNTCGTQQNCSYQCLQSGKAHQSSTIVINNKEWSCYCRKCTGKILRARKCQRNKWKAAYGNCLELILFVATPPTNAQHYYHMYVHANIIRPSIRKAKTGLSLFMYDKSIHKYTKMIVIGIQVFGKQVQSPYNISILQNYTYT